MVPGFGWGFCFVACFCVTPVSAEGHSGRFGSNLRFKVRNFALEAPMPVTKEDALEYHSKPTAGKIDRKSVV